MLLIDELLQTSDAPKVEYIAICPVIKVKLNDHSKGHLSCLLICSIFAISSLLQVLVISCIQLIDELTYFVCIQIVLKLYVIKCCALVFLFILL